MSTQPVHSAEALNDALQVGMIGLADAEVIPGPGSQAQANQNKEN